jgi:nucleotide-binding universal stress UspA family protein
VKRVLVAYDGSTAARRALARASEIGRGADGVTVVHVMPVPGVGAGIAPPNRERNEQWRLLEEARQFLAGRGIEVDTAARVGEAAAEILAVADELGADVVVIGRRRGRRAHILGSTSSRIVRDAKCDVLVVHVADGESRSR